MRIRMVIALIMVPGVLAAVAACGSGSTTDASSPGAAPPTSSGGTCTRPALTQPGGSFTITEKDNGRSYCVSVGTGIFVFLHGTPAAMWSPIRPDSAVVAARPSGVMMLMRGVTGAHFVVTGRGRAEITAARYPCHLLAGRAPASCPARDLFRVVVLIGGLPSA